MTANRKYRTGMTLLEILIAISLVAVLLGFVWGMVTLFSKDYLAGEKRVNRAQLVRSVSQMLSDDLGAAVQDPIHPVKTGGTETIYVRRFGLRGDESSMQIDVVEPNLLVKSATLAENRAAAASSSKPARPQAPDLKTVFYEFVRPNALQTQTAEPHNKNGSKPEQVTAGIVRKYGLSRKEISYEEPDPELEKAEKEKSKPIGSLSTGGFGGSDSDNSVLLESARSAAVVNEPFLTAPQVAMEIDDGTLWMPEVVDCRFRYYDGTRWYSSWDSIKRNGLPTAIEADLKLLPLDDVEEIRSSSLLPRIIYPSNRFSGTQTVSRNQQNGNGQITIETASELLDLSPVIVKSIVTRLPITPLSSHQTFTRRKPLPAVKGQVGKGTGSGSGSIGTAHGDLIGGRTGSGTDGMFPVSGTGGNAPFGGLLAPDRVNEPTPFDNIDSLLTGFEPAASGSDGMISAQAGTPIPTETTAPAAAKTGTQQGWIRGNR